MEDDRTISIFSNTSHRASAAKDALSDKASEEKHDTKASGYKEAI
jgi:hypothetical protein